MNRYFLLIQGAVYVIYFVILSGGINIIKYFVLIGKSPHYDALSFFPFLLNLIFCVACGFMVFYGKKYLYNFDYFGAPVVVTPDDNLTRRLSYEPEDYEEVPEPYKLMIPFYIVSAIAALSLFSYLSHMILYLVMSLHLSPVADMIGRMYTLLQTTPLFKMTLIPAEALLFFSVNMILQMKHYKKYYAVLLTNEENEGIDLTKELHENH